MTRARTTPVTPNPLGTRAALLGGVLLIAAVVALVASCARPPAESDGSGTSTPVPDRALGAVSFSPDELQTIFTLSPLPPVPPSPTNAFADKPAAAHLGQFLFFDARLSGNGRVSCATCHDPARNWTDGEPTPPNFSKDLRHVPSLWNVAYNRWYFWDGRADSLWSQALDPLESPIEHAGTRQQLARLIHDDPPLRRAYELVFGAPPELEAPAAPNSSEPPPADRVFVNLGKAIEAYERRIVSRQSPFDTFIDGLRARDPERVSAISPAAQRGLKLFIGSANCLSCHHGPNFTDGEFHDTGIAAFSRLPAPDAGRMQGINRLLTSPFSAMGAFNDDPDGRRAHPTAFLVNMTDRRGQFKTPSLRNVAVTAPYMHRGQLATLDDVVRFYSTFAPPAPATPPPAVPPQRTLSGHRHAAGSDGEHVLVPLNLSRGEIEDLVAFLESLTGEPIDPSLTTQPPSPVYAGPAR